MDLRPAVHAWYKPLNIHECCKMKGIKNIKRETSKTFAEMKGSLLKFTGTVQLCKSNFWAGFLDHLASRVQP
jgi:hypothetical protein